MLASGNFSLFIQGDAPSYVQDDFPLALHGSTQSGVFGGFPLTLYNVASDQRESGWFPVWVGGAPGPVSGQFPLYLAGASHSLSASFDVFVANTGVAAYFPLYTRGSGVTEGALPLDASFPLFLQRPTADAFTLYVMGPGTPCSGDFPLFTQGGHFVESGFPLAVPEVTAQETASVNVYLTGW